jgi:hypothetical protein
VKQKITILTPKGPVQTEGYVTGPLAFHRPILSLTSNIAFGVKDWHITHLPTGKAIIRSIPRIDQARKAVRELLDTGINWNAVNQDNILSLPKSARDEVVRIKRRYQGKYER